MGRGEGEKFWSGKKDKGLGRKPEINIFHRPTFTAPPTVVSTLFIILHPKIVCFSK